MKEENFKELLSLPEINASGIANKMFGEKPSSRSRLNDKVNNRKSGNGHQRLTDEDLAKAKTVLKDLADKIYRLIQ